MNEFTTVCPNCSMPLLFLLPADSVKIICPECGLRLYRRKRVEDKENRIARILSRGITPKCLSG